MLDFRTETFLEACKCLNFTNAAKNLHITQPAVTQHVHFLEQYYGTKLFLHEGKKLRLTGEGEALRRMLSAQKHDAAYLKEKLKAAGDNRKSIRFGVTLTIGEFVIAGPLARLLQRYPELSVHIETANTKELLNRIGQGNLEFAIMEGNFPREEYDSMIYSRENFIAVCGAGYRLKKSTGQPGDSRQNKNMLQVEDLLAERLIVREEGSGTREVLLKDLERRNLTIDDFAGVVEIGNMSAIKSLVSYGCGISFLYETAVKEELAAGTLIKLEPVDFSLTHDFSFVWPKGSFFDEDYMKIFKQLHGQVNNPCGPADI